MELRKKARAKASPAYSSEKEHTVEEELDFNINDGPNAANRRRPREDDYHDGASNTNKRPRIENKAAEAAPASGPLKAGSYYAISLTSLVQTMVGTSGKFWIGKFLGNWTEDRKPMFMGMMDKGNNTSFEHLLFEIPAELHQVLTEVKLVPPQVLGGYYTLLEVDKIAAENKASTNAPVITQVEPIGVTTAIIVQNLPRVARSDELVQAWPSIDHRNTPTAQSSNMMEVMKFLVNQKCLQVELFNPIKNNSRNTATPVFVYFIALIRGIEKSSWLVGEDKDKMLTKYQQNNLNIKDVLQVDLVVVEFAKATGISRDRIKPNIDLLVKTGAIVPDVSNGNIGYITLPPAPFIASKKQE